MPGLRRHRLPKGIQTLAASAKAVDPIASAGPWFWYGTFGLILINAGVGLMIESGLLRGYPRRPPED